MNIIARYDKSTIPWGPRCTGIYGHLPKFSTVEYSTGRRLHWWERRVTYKGYLVLITKKHRYVFNYMGRQGYGSNKILDRQ